MAVDACVNRPEVAIRNVVLMAELPHSLDMRAVQEVLTGVEPLWPRSHDAGLSLRLRKPGVMVNIYKSGKLVVLGARSVRMALKAVRKVIYLLRAGGLIIEKPTRTRVVNLVATADLQGEVDLERAAVELMSQGRAVYDPEQYPALIYHPDGSRCLKLLVFGNGKITCVGAKSEEEAREAIAKLASELEARGLILHIEDGDENEPSENVTRAKGKRASSSGINYVSVPLPERYLEGLEELVRQGRYPSRSEAIRVAVRDLLLRELWNGG